MQFFVLICSKAEPFRLNLFYFKLLENLASHRLINQQNRILHISGCVDVCIIFSSVFQTAGKLGFTLNFMLNQLCFIAVTLNGLEQTKEQGNGMIPGAPCILAHLSQPRT